MRKNIFSGNNCLRLAALTPVAVLLAACASMGRPEGGPRDVTPPEFVRAVPAPGSLNVDRTRLDAWFDENIELEDAFNKVIVSPTQKTAPIVRSLGKHLSVELRDTLLPNTTYTIDFADAVKDLNEGNILDGFALDFSTGPTIDTMRISGIVLEARTLEPAQGMTVGVYSMPADTAIATLPLERIARTNQLGQFTVRNLKPGRYGVYALNDVNRDNHWNRTEDVAFYDVLVSPTVHDIEVSDTLRTDHDTDSIVTRPGIEYLPNDILLTWFNEDFRQQYLKDHSRPERHRLTVIHGAPLDSLPTLTFTGGPLDGQNVMDHALLQKNQTLDTLNYWLRTPESMAIDSMLLEVRHRGLDSLENLTWKTDTLRFFWKDPKVKDKKKDKKEEADTVAPPIPLLGVSVTSSTQHDVYTPITLQSITPIRSIDSAMVHLEVQVDTLWKAVEGRVFRPDSLNPLQVYNMDFSPEPGLKYRLTVDSMAIHDIYGLYNKKIEHNLQVKQLEEYSSLAFKINGVADSIPVVVELLNESDKPVRVLAADASRKVNFRYLKPGTYYARLFLDVNNDGEWTTGKVLDSIQPEEVYYYNKALELRANWDVEQTWAVYELALDKQKPSKIKKNKPKTKSGQDTYEEDGEVIYDEWGEPIDPSDRRYRDARYHNGNGGNGNGMVNPLGGALGGFQQATGNSAGAVRR